eukprot:15335346-Ditylum_brightwellii.AAC.1
MQVMFDRYWLSMEEGGLKNQHSAKSSGYMASTFNTQQTANYGCVGGPVKIDTKSSMSENSFMKAARRNMATDLL